MLLKDCLETGDYLSPPYDVDTGETYKWNTWIQDKQAPYFCAEKEERNHFRYLVQDRENRWMDGRVIGGEVGEVFREQFVDLLVSRKMVAFLKKVLAHESPTYVPRRVGFLKTAMNIIRYDNMIIDRDVLKGIKVNKKHTADLFYWLLRHKIIGIIHYPAKNPTAVLWREYYNRHFLQVNKHGVAGSHGMLFTEALMMNPFLLLVRDGVCSEFEIDKWKRARFIYEQLTKEAVQSWNERAGEREDAESQWG